MTRLLLACLLTAPLFAAPPWLLTPTELATLAQHAPAALKVPLTTVVEGASLPGGDPHDYVSYARYYWPDPAKPDGLPFIKHDGRHNHEQVALGDRPRIGTFTDTVTALAAAWQLNHDETAARRAGVWLRAWYVDPATRMNPNLDYGQVQLGRHGNRGNPTGVLDTRDFALVVDALRLLDDSPALSAAERAEIQSWFASYLDWLLTAPNARAERAATNNHGTWYFAHVIPVARYAGRDDVARDLCRAAQERIGQQIQPNGRQPEEIARVDGLGYSRFNLEAWFRVVHLARDLQIDLWNDTAPNGASLRGALAYLRPYNADPTAWPHTQNAKLAPGFLDDLLAQAAVFNAATAKP